MIQTFMVADMNGGRSIKAVQLATFAHYIEGVQFRFVVTRLPVPSSIGVTHRDSGKRVCELSDDAIAAAAGDYVVAARGELGKLIQRVGTARMRSVLAAA
ncbi:hypothetical protein DM48_7853 [Burkholderia gladioli]|uniref:Uncharacterized protein n=1 Tax=Burkholderia gladioli TaxID=28095 RepID=A0AAW3FCG6_BURGA|nr:hypothetical protein [Burkholderia gladioli]KGC20292.1 hypothetical protein DM48_7853 [Burkholderia gladioli]